MLIHFPTKLFMVAIFNYFMIMIFVIKHLININFLNHLSNLKLILVTKYFNFNFQKNFLVNLKLLLLNHRHHVINIVIIIGLIHLYLI